MEFNSTASPEDLLEHLPWVRALARRLVADESTADDVAQESMIAALRKPPEGTSEADGGLRPWLAAVVRNVVRQRARREARRSHREEAGASAESLPSALELNARAEAQRLLLDAILVLEEDARRLVLLRYDEGLSAAEIARRTGQNHGTVRSRLKRALDRLRSELDRRHGGDRSAWLAGLTPLVGTRAAKGAGAVATPGALVAVAVGLALATVVGLAALALGLLPTDRKGGETRTSASEARASGFVEMRSAEPALVASVPEGGGRRAEAQPKQIGGDSAAPGPTTDSGAAFGEVKMRFIDEDGSPVDRVRVKARGSEPMMSDLNGRLDYGAWFGPRGVSTELAIERFGFASDVIPAKGRAGALYDLGDVVLQRGGDIEGVVVDAEGRQVPGLTVAIQGRLGAASFSGGLGPQRVTELGATKDVTDEDGRFRLRGACAGAVDIKVQSENGVWSGKAGAVRVKPGELTKDVVITATEAPVDTRIEGVIHDHLGEPEAGAFIVLEWGGWFSKHRSVAEADEHGHFVAIVGRRARVKVNVCARGSMVGLATFEDVRAGTLDLNVHLREPCERLVRVLDEDGAPVLRAGVRVKMTGGGLGERFTDAAGTVRIPLATHSMKLRVSATGYGSEALELDGALPQDWDAALRGELGELDVVLARTALLSGSIHAESGVARDCEISVMPAATRRVLVGGLPSLVEDEVVAQGRTERSGRFALSVDASGSFLARVDAPGYAPLWIGPFDHEPLRGRDLGAHTLIRGGALKGRVLDGDSADQRHTVMITSGDGFVRSTTTTTRGDYSFDNVMPGPCFVRVVDRAYSGRGAGSNSSLGLPYRSIEGDVVVRDGETVTHDLRTGRAFEAIELEGQLTCEGFDPTRFSAALVPAGPGIARGEFGAAVSLDDEGRFTLEQTAPGAYALSLRDTSKGVDGETLTLGALLDLGPGINRWEQSVSFGEVRTGEHAEPSNERLFVELADGLFAFAPLARPDGTRPFPAGEVQRTTLLSYHASLLAQRFDLLDVLERVSLRRGRVATVGD